MTRDLVGSRGITDRESGSAIIEAAGKAMVHTIYETMPGDLELNDTNLTMLGLVTRLQAFNEVAAREIAANNRFSSASLIRSLTEVVALIC